MVEVLEQSRFLEIPYHQGLKLFTSFHIVTKEGSNTVFCLLHSRVCRGAGKSLVGKHLKKELRFVNIEDILGIKFLNDLKN